MAQSFIDILRSRNLLHQCTNEAAFTRHLAGGVRRGYAGFDPTADSLTIGNLVPLMMLANFQRAGHAPVVLMGGGTGMIGDPSGKSAERQLQTLEKVAANVESQRRVFERVLDFSKGANAAVLVNNADWLMKLGFIEVLRDVGKFFTVNAMVQKDSVRDRFQNREQGISYTEFSYQILQAHDFQHLHATAGVTVQMGGSDQWGNITAGTDLIRKKKSAEALAAGLNEPEHDEVFGVTAPLVTKADGGKFGKTEGGAIWLNADRTSPFAYYQFWINAADADVGRFLRIYTFIPAAEIEAIETAHAADPGKREAQKRLAAAATEIIHGATERAKAEEATRALFTGEVGSLSEDQINEVFSAMPQSTHSRDALAAGVDAADLLVETGMVKSKREAREMLTAGSITANGRKLAVGDQLGAQDLLHGRCIALRKGKKNWHIARFGA